MSRSIRLAAVVLASAANMLAPQTPDSAALAPLLRYVGSYVVGEQRELAISIQETPNGPMLFFADVSTGDVRVLFPTGADEFAAGPELLRPEPVKFRVRFHVANNRPADSLTLSGAAWPHGATARHIATHVESVRFKSGGLTLEGTLLRPPGSQRAPLVVLANGSEDSDRYGLGSIPSVLANHGMAVFIYDKRGTGASSGSWQDAGIDDLATDLVAAIATLRTHAGVDAKRIGVLGFSEGGWVAPFATSLTPDIRFVVAISGGGTTKGATFVYKDRRRFLEAGLAGRALDSAVATSEATIAASLERVRTNAAPSGFDRRVAYNPAAHWQAFKGPVLFIGGEYDVLDDARQSADSLRSIFTRSGNFDATVLVLPRAHHYPFLGVTGLPSEFGRFSGVGQTVPGFWDILIRWLDTRTSSDRSDARR